jgi:hypothetical protein
VIKMGHLRLTSVMEGMLDYMQSPIRKWTGFVGIDIFQSMCGLETGFASLCSILAKITNSYGCGERGAFKIS